MNRNCPWFDAGETLELLPRLSPPEPWGYNLYPPATPAQLDGLRNFDPDAGVDKETIAHVKIIKHLSNDTKGFYQVLLCKMTKYPRSLVQPQMPFPRLYPETKTKDSVDYFIVKVSNGLVFPGGPGNPPYGNWQLAEHFYARESAALRLHYEKHLVRGNIMGSPYHVPSYYGTWVVKVPYVNEEDRNAPKIRYAGAIAVEYIRGLSIKNLCISNDPEDPVLVPKDYDVRPEYRSALGSMNPQDETFRLDVLKLWLDGVVKSLHVGVQLHNLSPRNILVTVLDLNGSPIPTRVVLADYSCSEIYEKNKYARNPELPEWPSRHPLTELPNPPHPFERFCIHSIWRFQGWYPERWDTSPWLCEHWLGWVFGKIEDSSKYSVFRMSTNDYYAFGKIGDSSEFMDNNNRRVRELRKTVADLAAESRSSQPEAWYSEDCENAIEELRSQKADEWVVRNVETVNGAAPPSWHTIYEELKTGAIVSCVKFLTSKRQRSESEDASEGETSGSKRQKQ
ncbi:hypothetical protein K4K58_011440 [Colletotrichum sp. SAR11_239]|nr:hypothetical protein K4K58_011440 [Colletotrichum sp. SAR11_239]